MKILKISIFVIILAIIFSCQHNGNFEEYKKVDPSGWQQDSIAEFTFDIHDTKAIYNLTVNVRNTGDYPYSNIWMFVDIAAPDNSMVRDTVEFQMALANGKWVGKGAGGIFSCRFPYRNNVFFPTEGTYRLKIKHGMRNDILKGISDVGIRIDKR